MLIWRGMGILVPIVFFIIGFIVSLVSGDPDTKVGNPTFIGWTSLWSGIVLTLIGVALLGGDSKDSQGNPIKKKHDFFWIPVILWGLFLGILSLVLLVFVGKSDADASNDTPSSESTTTIPTELPTPTTRIVNFYNPTKDSITYLVADEKADGLIEGKKVAPMSYVSMELEKGDYLFTAFDKAGTTTIDFPHEEDAGNAEKYVLLEDEDGKFYQRIVGAATVETDDYDEAWLMLDGKTDMLVVNVTEACAPDYSLESMESGDWATAIHEELDSRDLLEPMYKQFIKGENIRMLAPGDKIPTKIAAKDTYFLLVPFHGEKDRNKVIMQAVKAARF